MNTVLWITAGLLAVAFAVSGATQLAPSKDKPDPARSDVAQPTAAARHASRSA